MVPVTRTGSGTKDMAALMERVRRMSDSQLADVLAGKDVSIPQFAAMTEAMGRKQLRQAVDGAQAQQQAQQPSLKDQLLAEQQMPAGIDQLPAPNMESVDMASGGIIAFEDGGKVPGYAAGVYTDPLDYLSGQDIESKAADEIRRSRELQKYKELYGFEKYPVAPAAAVDPKDEKEVKDNKDTNPPAAPPAANPPVPRDYLLSGTKFERRTSPFGSFSPEATNYDKLKSQGLGEALLGASEALMTKAGPAGLGAAFGALGKQAGLTRKEMNALKRDERDYGLNYAKAEEAFSQGQDDLGYKYLSEANQNRYRMGMLNKPGAGLEMLQALKDPELMKRYLKMQEGKRPTDTVTKEKALANWKNVSPKEKRDKYGDDFNTYYNYLNNQLLTDTIGDGADVLGKV